MNEYITQIAGQAAVSAAIVWAFVQLFKKGVPAKWLPIRSYPWLALVLGILINEFIGSRINMDWRDSAAVGAVSALIAIGVFKYGKSEELKSEYVRKLREP